MAEKNQLQWIGARPVYPVENIQVHPGPFETSVAGKARTQILKSVEVNNELGIIHWVTAGKIFYLTACSGSADYVSGGVGHIFVLDEREDDVYRLLNLQTRNGFDISKSISFPFPLRIPPPLGVAVYIENPNGRGSITGWEE